jgi:hypothetical protein
MTREETKKLLCTIHQIYPSYAPDDISGTVDTWADMLSAVPYREAHAALKRYVFKNKSGFAPSIGQIVAFMDSNEYEEVKA